MKTCTCFRLPCIHPYERACSDYADEQIRFADEYERGVKGHKSDRVAGRVLGFIVGGVLAYVAFCKAFWS